MRVIQKVASNRRLLRLKVVAERHDHMLELLDSFFRIDFVLVSVLEFRLSQILSVLLDLHGTTQDMVLLADSLVICL